MERFNGRYISMGGSVCKINDVVEGRKYDKRRVNEWMTDS